MSAEDKGGPSESKLDAGMEAAFGAPEGGAEGLSVLQTVARLTGRAPKVLLRDDSSPDAASPVIKASARKELPLTAGRGNYQLLGEIASGGMGAVMKAHDLDLGRDVALKVLHEKLAKDPAILQRFVEEAQIGGQLQHPGIVPVYELGLMADDRPFFTMKLVKGHTLGALLKARKSPDEDRHRFLTIFEHICQTLAYAHSKGVIHRDLKPANVMVGAFGEVQVVDWGLAKVLGSSAHDDSELAEGASQISVIETVRSADTEASASLVGSILGTPAYMPPEQAKGEVDQLDERADVFALGALLAEILTGKPPYLGQRQVALTMAARGNQAEVLERLDDCGADAELIELSKNCLDPVLVMRPADAGEVSERMRDHLASVEVRAREAQVEAAEAQVRATEERRRRRLTLTLAATILALVVGVGGGWVYIDKQRAEAEGDRLARIARTESQVDDATGKAQVAAAKLDWTGAIAHLERGLALTKAGESGAGLATTVEAELEEARAKAKAAEDQAELERDNENLLAALERVHRPWGLPAEERDYPQEETDLGQALWGFDIRPDADGAEATAAKVRARGQEMAMELAAVFEEWARLRGKAQVDGAEVLLRVADLADPDETRVALRRAIRRRDQPTMQAAAAREDLDQLPVRTLALLGQALYALSSLQDAIAVFRVGIQRHPDSFTLHMGMQATLIGSRPPRYQESMEHVQAARALRPESAATWSRMGYVLQELGRLEEAIESYDRAIELDSEDAPAHGRRGLALQMLGHHEEAIESYERVIELDGEDADAHNSLAWLLATVDDIELRNPSEAVRHARRAAALAPATSYTWGTLGAALYRAGDAPGAIEQLTKATRMASEKGEAPSVGHALFLCMAHHARGAQEEARTWYDRGVEWMEADSRPDPDQLRFRAEAAELLGIEESDDE